MRTSAVFFASVLTLGALLPIACTQDFGIFEPSGSGSSSSAAGGSAATTSTTSSTGTSGTGGAPACQTGDACSDQNPCTTDSCDTTAGQCAHKNVPDGPTTDAPDDGNPCTENICTNGVLMNANLPLDTSCGANLSCDDNGACVGCVKASQCMPPGICKVVTCESKACKYSDSPPGQSCDGGNVCDGKGSCVTCLATSDCSGGKICVGNMCVGSCTTGVKDGTESDVDCGGGSCPKCTIGKICGAPGDCASATCTMGLCAAPAPSCMDTIKNGTETDIDCGGGGGCPKCAGGKMCGGPSDCMSGMCMNQVCAP